MSALQKELWVEYAPKVKSATRHRITVVGAGQVGMACVVSILAQGISNDVVIIDCMEDRLRGELMDLEHGSTFLKNPRIQAGSDYKLTAGSYICVITAGARQKEGESRLSLVQRNTDILKGIVPQLIKHSPDTILLLVSNPVDVLTYVAWKLSGLPKNKVFGSGTNLDSARFRVLLSQKLGVSSTSCHAWIIGEHGDSSIAVWSGANVAGVRLSEICPQIGTGQDKDKFQEVHGEVVNAAYNIIKLKGYTSWAIGLSVAALVQSIVHDTSNVHPVSVCVKGHHGIQDEVFFSLPAILEQNGVVGVIKQSLNSEEQQKLQESARLIKEVQDKLKF